MYRLFYIILIFLIATQVNGQTKTEFQLSNTTLVSSGELPFWLWANRDGKINSSASFLNLTEFSTRVTGKLKRITGFHYKAGANLVGGLGNESYFHPNQLFAGLDYNGWQLEAGMFTDDLQFNGLSTTNGNLARSRNARPYPKIRFSALTFKPVPGVQNWLAFRFEYDEGILNDNRYVSDTHLHHKSFYFKIQPQRSDWDVQFGAEHFVMWGGTSRDDYIGKMPSDFKSYLLYFFGSMGSDNFPINDQLNVAGNQYGTYQVLFTKQFSTFTASLNLSHPFDDFSGVNWRNWPDNLIGLYVEFIDQEKFISHILYEFTNTRQQSITDSIFSWNNTKAIWEREPSDNYYSHGIYKSGATYHQQAMCSPLFAPVILKEGISRGFGSNRFYSHHLGVAGTLLNEITWKGLATYTHYLGTYGNPYEPAKSQLSLLLDLKYNGAYLPFDVGLLLAADIGEMYNNSVGAQFIISKNW